MGAHMRVSNVGTEQDFKVVKIISHSSYHNSLRYSYDIVLIKLEKPAILNKAVGLVCVPDGNSPAMPIDDSSKKCWITGWGRLASGGATPDRLMQASVPLVSKARYCSFYYIHIGIQANVLSNTYHIFWSMVHELRYVVCKPIKTQELQYSMAIF